MGRFSPQLGWKSYVIPTNGPIPTTGLKIIRHSHKWADFTLTVTMTRRYVSRMTSIANRKKKQQKNTWDGRPLYCTCRRWESLPGRSSCKRGPKRCISPKRQKRPLGYEQSNTVQLFLVVVHGSILNKQTQKK